MAAATKTAVAAAGRITMSNLHAKKPPHLIAHFGSWQGRWQKIILQCSAQNKRARMHPSLPLRAAGAFFCARICINPFASPHVCSRFEIPFECAQPPLRAALPHTRGILFLLGSDSFYVTYTFFSNPSFVPRTFVHHHYAPVVSACATCAAFCLSPP
jgi:hypothetical protein